MTAHALHSFGDRRPLSRRSAGLTSLFAAQFDFKIVASCRDRRESFHAAGLFHPSIEHGELVAAVAAGTCSVIPKDAAVSEGLSNKAIARRLNISHGTIKVHLLHIYQKLEINNRTVLAALAISQN